MIDIHTPSAPIVTVFGMVGQSANANQGIGRPTRISKMLLPIELDTAMSPSPILATITLDNKSGTEVPAAKNVNPMMKVSIPKVAQIVSVQPTMKYE